VTVLCDAPVVLLTGSPRTIAEITRGPLIVVPLFATFLGIGLFFPRFIAILATPFWSQDRLTRLLRTPPPRPDK